MRDWLEGQHWYWYTINLSLNIFPWHWEIEWSRYKWGLIARFGPLGMLLGWPLKEEHEPKE